MDQIGAAVARLSGALGVAAAAGPVGGGDRRARRVAGLTVARAALDAAGANGLGVLGHHADGRPRWPSGWTGSIAHTDTHAVAAVSAVRNHRAIGIDIERRRGLTLDDAALVLGTDEQELASGSSDPSDAATALWSAKESAFKAWATAVGGLPRVDPVDIRIDLGDGEFTATAVGALADHDRPLTTLTGRFDLGDDIVTTLAVLP